MEQKDYKINFIRMFIASILWMSFLFYMMFLMSRCTVTHHLKAADKHIKKAIEKGAIIKPDTLYKYIYDIDTIYNEKTNTITITRHAIDSIPYVITQKIYVPMSRQERLRYRDSLSHIRELYELQSARLKQALKYKTKQVKHEQKTNRKNSPVSFVKNLLWLLVVLSVVYVIIKLYPKL
jgi:hypothetical protein